MNASETIRRLWGQVKWLESEADRRKNDTSMQRPFQHLLKDATALRHCIELFDAVRTLGLVKASALKRVRYQSEEKAAEWARARANAEQ
jgi:hypothetical protein